MVRALLFGAEHSHADASGLAEPDQARTDPPARPTSMPRPLRVTEIVWPDHLLQVISTAGRGPVARLTSGEYEVARSAASGMSNFDIAVTRKSSPRTIANQLASAFRKLGVASRAELAAALFSTKHGSTDT